jgi:transcription elongation factor SPT5
MERDIVIGILQKILKAPSDHGVLAAFCRDAIKGSIYIESRDINSVTTHILNGTPGIMRFKGVYRISLVDTQDRNLLLNMSVAGRAPPIKHYSWVRVKRGVYRGDLGLVSDVNEATLSCSVLVVPRIHIGRKRKRGVRPPQVSFDPEAIREAFGQDAVEKRNRLYIFKGGIYDDGLLEMDTHMTDLSIEGLNATEEELEPFRQSRLWGMSNTFISPIRVGDRVRVVSGTFVGIVGEIVEVLSMTVQIKWGANDAIEVLTCDVRKAFEIGDFVQVIRGIDRGLEGFLLCLEDKLASIYILPSDSDDPEKRAGHEVSYQS